MTEHAGGFRDRTRLADARRALLDLVDSHDRTERVPVERADGRVLTSPVSPERPVPHYDRAAMDGFAVVAQSTFGASDRSPTELDVGGRDGVVDDRTAVPVHTGSELPEGANAVVMVEDTERFGESIEVRTSVTDGENVSPAGEDVPIDAALFADGHRLRPSDLGLLRSVGRREVAVYEPPTVEVIPTGNELVDADPAPGEVVETNALTVSRYVARWGGDPTYRNVVSDDDAALRAAIERGLTADIVVTTGGSSVGERDRIADVVADLGDISHHGLAIKPGHPVGFGIVADTPILMLPGYPVSCIVTAVQLLCPALKRAGNLPTPFGDDAGHEHRHPTVSATLDRKLASEPGVRTFARVRLEARTSDDRGTGDGDVVDFDAEDLDAEAEGDAEDVDADADVGAEGAGPHEDDVRAIPVRTGGASVLSSVTDADGWVTIPESVEGLDAGETVTVEDWEYTP
jgi:molybdopterin molybdotransferase